MKIVIDKPKNISTSYLRQIVNLLVSGEQLQNEGLQKRIMKADLIALIENNKTIVTTATLKNPAISYKESVFEQAGVKGEEKGYLKELGYIVTQPIHEGTGYCQQLLTAFIPLISQHAMYATTRKSSMVHILSKFQFISRGKPYKDGLTLLVRSSD